MSLFGWIIVGLGLAVAAWLVTRLNKTNDSSAVAKHSGVGHAGADATTNTANDAVEAHSGVGYTGMATKVEPAPQAIEAAAEVVEKPARKAAKKAPAKKAAVKAPKKTSK